MFDGSDAGTFVVGPLDQLLKVSQPLHVDVWMCGEDVKLRLDYYLMSSCHMLLVP
jgi:hypothetical protein